MDKTKLSQLQSKLKHAIFLAGKDNNQETQSVIIECYGIASQLQELGLTDTELPSSNQAEIQEIKKISQRLGRWARNQHQINSKILNAFLALERSGKPNITEEDIRKEFLKDKSRDPGQFEGNFPQMKTSSSKSHGKIFKQYGEYVNLWSPIVPEIRKYEKSVFGRK